MLSPEHGFRPRELYAPVDRMGGHTSVPTEPETPQQDRISEVPLNESSNALLDNSPIKVENVLPESNQDEGSAIGQAAQSLAVPTELPTEHTEEQVQEVMDTIELSSLSTQQANSTINREEQRRQEAIKLGLPEDANDYEIRVRRDMNKRKELAIELNMLSSRNKEFAAEMEQLGVDPYPRWETILYHALHVSGLTSKQVPPEEMAKRIKMARKMFRQMEKEQQKRAIKENR